MRRLLIAASLALLLNGCATTPTSTSDAISQIQAATVAACAFLPTAATIANILASGNPIVGSITAVAGAICAAVSPPQGVKRGVPMVGGVVIHGRFVR